MREGLTAGVAGVVVFALAFLYAYWQAILPMIADWRTDPNYSHGFLVPLIAAYVAWERRQEILAATRKPSSSGLALVGGGLILFLIGHLAGVNFTKQFSMLLVIAGAILFTAGKDVLRIVKFPIAYLVFMLPLPYLLYDAVAFPLKLLVSWVSVASLRLLGIPVTRDGNIISLAATTLEVTDACSGIRSIISLLALSVALAYFTQKSWPHKVTLVVLSLPIALVANAFRVIATGILASRYGAVVAQGFFHELAGIVIFGVATVLLLAASYALNRLGRDE